MQPYYKGRVGLPRARSRVARVLERLRMEDALAILQDAALTNRRWLDEVALPLLAPEPGPQSLELRGKKLVDHFRADIASVQMLLARREASSDAGAQRAILLVGFFAFGAAAAVIVAALLFTIQQYRLSVRLERERENAEAERRHSAEIRAAYEAEKRIAETLQGAFVQNVLPEPAMLRLGATYLPAAEESKVGGDWYDAFELPDGRVLLAIGDVAGHGIDAAVAMNATRQLLISCALIDPRPGPVLERVNAELFRNQSPLVTAMAALVDAGKCELDTWWPVIRRRCSWNPDGALAFWRLARFRSACWVVPRTGPIAFEACPARWSFSTPMARSSTRATSSQEKSCCWPPSNPRRRHRRPMSPRQFATASSMTARPPTTSRF